MVRCSLKSIIFLFTLFSFTSIYYFSYNITSIISVVEEEDENIYYQVPPTNSVTYIRSAFRVYNSEIRISVIRRHRSHAYLYYKYGKEIAKLYFICELSSCLDFYSKPCNMIGYIGIIKNNKLGNDEFIYFSTTNDPKSFNVKVKLLDVRVPQNYTYPHSLGVCIQPIYLHADYFLFIQFFEYWLSQGATKFYIYRESYTKEVQKILDFYISSSNASIELIDWSQLPSPKGEENVNNFIYRLEMMLSIFDCVTRARSNVKFLAQTDLDEFIHIKNGEKVVDFMKKFDASHSQFASASFSSQRIAYQKEFLDTFESPADVSFAFLENVKIENQIFKRPYYSKLIYRPERVINVHPHKQMRPDKPANNIQRRYTNALISNNDGLVMHMRRINDTFEWKKTENTTIFASLAKTLTKNYQNRIQNYQFDEYEWQNVGVQIVEEVDRCRKLASENRTKQCHSVYNCEKNLSQIHQNFFTKVKNSWVFL